MNRPFVKKLFQKYHLRPSKRLGQHFLISQKVLQKIVQTAGLSEKDVVLEIGPGLGVLTEQLAQRAKKVIAVEKDHRLSQILKEILKDYNNIEIIQGDVLRIQGLSLRTTFWRSQDVSERTILELKNYKLIANLPYYITSPLIRLFLESKVPPQLMVLLIQKEVAQRICARPPQMSLLAVAVQFYSRPKIIAYVSKKSFWPQPKVDSAIIKIRPRSPAMASKEYRKKFFQIVKAGFSSPRKQLVNNLFRKLNLDRQKIKKALTECRLDIKVRAENLSVEDWLNLYEIIN